MAYNPNSKNEQQTFGWKIPTTIQPTHPVPQPGYAPQVGYAPQPQMTYPIQPGYPAGHVGPPQPQSYPPPYSVPIHGSSNIPGYPNQVDPTVDPESQKTELSPDNFGSSFSTRAIRHRFVRKVYTILTSQLVLTLGIVAVFSLQPDVKTFVQMNTWIFYLSYAVFFITYITLVCCKGVRRTWPGNFILLFVFTLSMSYLLGAISSFHKTQIVLLSVGITAVICFLITLFAVQTKIDFTGWGIYLCIASCVLFFFGLMAIFIRGSTMNLLYSGAIVLLFSMYLVFDTQRILGGRKHELSAEEHISGALVLYIDVVYIFLGILGLSRYN